MQYQVHYTEEQQAVRLMDMEAVKDLLARRAYLLSGGSRQEELERLWVAQPEHLAGASYGDNRGFITGMEALKESYAAAEAASQGYGAVHTVNTGHVVLAYDGATARGLFYDVYERSMAKPDGGCESVVVCGPVACDFVKEDGGWKIWHLFQGADHVFTVGEDYASVPIPRPDEGNPVYREYPEHTVNMKTYDPDFGWADNYPAIPEPYFTLTPENSYGPEGHPDYVKEVSFL